MKLCIDLDETPCPNLMPTICTAGRGLVGPAFGLLPTAQWTGAGAYPSRAGIAVRRRTLRQLSRLSAVGEGLERERRRQLKIYLVAPT